MQKTERLGTDLTSGNIMRQLIIFAIPILLTNIVQQLYTMVDLAVIGQFVGSAGTVGVSTGGEVNEMFTIVSMGLAGAGEVYISQLAGMQENRRINNAIGTMMTVLVATGLALGIFTIAFNQWFIDILNTPTEAISQAKDYMIVTALGMPLVFGYNAVCSALRGMGESKRPLQFIIIAAVANIFLDLLLVAVIPLEALGTAIATTASQIAAFGASLIFLYKKKDRFGFDFRLRSFAVKKEPLVVMLKLGIPRALQGMFITVSKVYCNSKANAYGLVESAVNSLGNRISGILSIVAHSVDTAGAVMVGQNLGARKFDRVKKTIYSCIALSAVMAAVNCAIAVFAPGLVFRLLSNDPEVIEFGKVFMRINIIAFILSIFHGSFCAMATGAGHATLGFIYTILDGVILRIGISVVLAEVFELGVISYFIGNATARIAPCIICGIYFYSGAWKKRKLLTEQ